jgi:hypothetical protein
MTDAYEIAADWWLEHATASQIAILADLAVLLEERERHGFEEGRRAERSLRRVEDKDYALFPRERLT